MAIQEMVKAENDWQEKYNALADAVQALVGGYCKARC